MPTIPILYTAKALSSEQLISRLNYEYGTEIQWDARILPSNEDKDHFLLWVVPGDWDGGDITLRLRLKCKTNSGNALLEVKYAVIQTGSLRSAETLVAFGATVTQAVPGTAEEEFSVDFTDTPGGTTGDLICFRIRRSGSDSGDTAGEIALTEVILLYENAAGTGTGEANTIGSVGAGVALAYGKSGVQLNTKSIIAGTGLSFDTTVPEQITLNVTASGGEANTASNVGGEAEVFKQKTGVDLAFRTLAAGNKSITLTQNTNTIDLFSGVQGIHTIASTGALSSSDILNKLVIGKTLGGAVVGTLPSLGVSDDLTRFWAKRDGPNLFSIVTPSASYHIKYPGYVNDQLLEFTSDGDCACLLYEHATQTFHVIG